MAAAHRHMDGQSQERQSLRAILYSAESHLDASEDSATFSGVEVHLQRLRRKAAERNYINCAEITDLDHSGSAMRGPGLERALQMLESDEADVLFAIRPDRLGRGSAEQEVRRRLLRCSKDWDFSDVIAPPLRARSSMDRFTRGVLQLASGKETWDAAERAWNRAHEAWLSGLWIGSPPFAYRIRSAEQADGTLAKLLLPEEAEVAQLKQLVEWLLSTGSVANTLKLAAAAGLRPRRRHRRVLKSGGSRWTRDTLVSMLRSRVYIGETRFTFACYTRLEAEAMTRQESGTASVVKRRPPKYELVDQTDEPRRWGCVKWRKGRHEPLLDYSVWQDVQRVLGECSGDSGRGRREDAQVRILAGHVVCGRHCIVWDQGAGDVRHRPLPFIVKPSGKRRADGSAIPYYERSDKIRTTPGIIVEVQDERWPGADRVNAEQLESMVMEELRLLSDPDDSYRRAIDDFIRSWSSIGVEECGKGLAELIAHLSSLKEEQRIYRARYEALLFGSAGLGDSAKELFESRLSSLKADILDADEALAELEDIKRLFAGLPAELELFHQLRERAIRLWDEEALPQLRTLLHRIIYPGRGVEILGRVKYDHPLNQSVCLRYTLNFKLHEHLEGLAARFKASKFVLKEEWRGRRDSNSRPPA